MRSALRYAAAIASVRAGISRLIASEQWRRLLSAGDFQEIETVLQQTALARVVTPTSGIMEAVERQLRAYLAENVRKPLKFLGGNVRAMLETLWRRFEVENTMTLLRGLHNQIPAARIRRALIPLDGISEIDWSTLAGTPSIARMVERLESLPKGPLFAEPLSEAMPEYERRGAVFVLETALELAHLRRLRMQIESLSGADRRSAEEFVGFRIDRRNFLAAFRYRIYFDLSPEDILGYTGPPGTQVGAETLQDIALGAPMDAVARNTWPDLSGLDRLEGRSSREALSDLEVLLDRYLQQKALRALSADPLSLRVILAFDVLLQHEIDDLIAVIEGKALARSVDTITFYLAGMRERS